MNDFKDLIEIPERNILTTLDSMEENIRLADKITKEYSDIKKQLKDKMLDYGKKNNLEQIKWITPKGIKITLSVGREEQIETRQEKVFSDELLRQKYPQIYEECCVMKDREVTIKAGSNDRLVVTMPKE